MDIKNNRFRYLRLQKNISLSYLANELNNKYNLNISKGTISRWENGKSRPSYVNIKCLTDYYNVTIEYLLNTTDKIEIDIKNDGKIDTKTLSRNKQINSIRNILIESDLTKKEINLVKDYIDYLKYRTMKK